MNSIKDPVLDELEEINERLWKEVEHLPLREAIRERMRRAEKAARDAGFTTTSLDDDEKNG